MGLSGKWIFVASSSYGRSWKWKCYIYCRWWKNLCMLLFVCPVVCLIFLALSVCLSVRAFSVFLSCLSRLDSTWTACCACLNILLSGCLFVCWSGFHINCLLGRGRTSRRCLTAFLSAFLSVHLSVYVSLRLLIWIPYKLLAGSWKNAQQVSEVQKLP